MCHASISTQKLHDLVSKVHYLELLLKWLWWFYKVWMWLKSGEGAHFVFNDGSKFYESLIKTAAVLDW